MLCHCLICVLSTNLLWVHDCLSSLCCLLDWLIDWFIHSLMHSFIFVFVVEVLFHCCTVRITWYSVLFYFVLKTSSCLLCCFPGSDWLKSSLWFSFVAFYSLYYSYYLTIPVILQKKRLLLPCVRTICRSCLQSHAQINTYPTNRLLSLVELVSVSMLILRCFFSVSSGGVQKCRVCFSY